MNLSFQAMLLWAAGFICNAALLSILVYKRRLRAVPWFAGWILFGITYSIALFLAYRFGSKHVYAVLYWGGAFLDLVLQLAVVMEIASKVFRRNGRWVEGARGRLGAIALLSPVVAGIMAWQMTPAATSVLDAWDSRASLFTTVVVCCLFSAVMLVSQQVGVSWQSRLLREGYGLMAWALVAFITDTLHAYWRTVEHFTALEHVRMVAYLGSLTYWMVVFWLPEKVIEPQDGSTKKRLEALRQELELRQMEKRIKG